ncbi:MAG TPA: sialate O-acetylesterase [Mucilaginibacter sp.]|jgi:sialate O-acetylesterase|nr:sialate O-acetylesterase [Mucilaginibacter sp.]
MKKTFFELFAFAIFLSGPFLAAADVVPNSLFSDHAVLQRNTPIPVWGTASDGEKIKIEFAGQKVKTIAYDGKWMIKLKPLKASGPFVMTITGNNTITISDILVGEVWVCSGQSNMELKLSQGIVNGEQEIAGAQYSQIRQFYVPNKPSHTHDAVINGTWLVCSPETVKGFTAVGYFFARDLYKKLNIPFGIISSSVGGTPAESWTSREAMQSNPLLKSVVDDYDNSVKTFSDRLAKFKLDEPSLLEKYNALVDSAKKLNKRLPPRPNAPQDPVLSGSAGGLYFGMILPLQPYAIKGVIWYQGEANSPRGEHYKILFPALIADWRKAWGQGDFPFLFVQIAPYKGMSPEIREAQLYSWKNTPNTAMAVTTDCGNAEDIHPKLKQPVGDRLARAAMALAYHKKGEYSGPVYDTIKIDGSKAILSFTHAKQLVTKGDTLKGFFIAGSDKKFVQAKAEINGNKIVVYSDEVTSPIAVRYGWANVPDVNLYNEEDLPASPFRTDNFKELPKAK